jgi:RES domain-containing protein
VVHAAETYSLAVLENLVHWQTSALPPGLVCVRAEIPSDIEGEELDPAHLPASAPGDFSAFRAIGDDWYDRSDTAVLWVPSLVSPYEMNVLFNQRHDDFHRIVIHDAIPARVDPRLWLREK